MGNILDDFINKKKAESLFLTLEDGENIKVLKVIAIKTLVKAGYAGEEIEVLRLIVEVETTEGIKPKSFDNGTQRFAKELVEKGIEVGSSFILSRTGEQTKTRYLISEVVNP